MITSLPVLISLLAKFCPIKPAPPVNNTLFILTFLFQSTFYL
jgi:hypothetical protein